MLSSIASNYIKYIQLNLFSSIQLDNTLKNQASENNSDKKKQLHRCINIHQRIFE